MAPLWHSRPSATVTRREGSRIHYSLANVHVAAMLEQALGHADHLLHGLPHEHGERA